MRDAVDAIVRAVRRDKRVWWSEDLAPLRALAAELGHGAPEDGSEEEEEAPPPLPPTAATSAQTVGDVLRGAREAYDAGRYDRADEMASRVLAERPTSVGALRIRGRCAFRDGRYTEARRILSDAQSLDYDAEAQEVLQACIDKLKRPAARQQAEAAPSPPTSDPRGASSSKDPFSQALGDPAIMEGVAKMLRDPAAMSAIQNSDLFKQMENMMSR